MRNPSSPRSFLCLFRTVAWLADSQRSRTPWLCFLLERKERQRRLPARWIRCWGRLAGALLQLCPSAAHRHLFCPISCLALFCSAPGLCIPLFTPPCSQFTALLPQPAEALEHFLPFGRKELCRLPRLPLLHAGFAFLRDGRGFSECSFVRVTFGFSPSWRQMEALPDSAGTSLKMG